MGSQFRVRFAATFCVILAVVFGLGSAVSAQPATTAEGKNTSSDADAGSGGASASNSAEGSAGPQAQAAPSDQQIGGGGDTSAAIVHEGDNKVEIEQRSTSRTGDAVAGSQITGIVAGPGSSVSVNNSNTSEDAEATSGDAFSSNVASADVGPRVFGGVDCPEAPDTDGNDVGACIVHEGDNEVSLSQTAVSETGDAVAGSQVTGIVASNGADVAVANTNSSEDDEATSGNADSTNESNAAAGPIVGAPILLTGNALSSDPSTAAIDVDGDLVASIVHEGDNEQDIEQNAASASGDAVAGGQITGVVADGGSVSITADNTSEDAESESGAATSSNTDADEGLFDGHVGPIVLFPGPGLDSLGPASIDVGGDLFADIVHEGDNSADLTQDASSSTGDAVAGGQVFGVVGSGGDIAIDATNSSEDDTAESGTADATNVGSAVAGPFVLGGGPTLGSASIDADFIGASIVHEGDNDAELEQSVDAASGDAVAGGQIAGLVGGGDAAIVLDNASEDAEATSGDASGSNDGFALAGDEAVDLGLLTFSIEAGAIEADIVHEGDNEAEVAQSVDAASGDAVAGGQIVGGVIGTGGSLAIDATNSSDGDEATSGEATGTNEGFAGAGDASISDALVLSRSIDADFIGASIVHDGDNDGSLDQSVDAASGDAVAGGQIMGAVGAGDVAIVADNTSEDAEAESGEATGSNVGNVNSGDAIFPILVLEPGEFSASIDVDGELFADIVHDGDNDASLDQTVDAASGDAVAGGGVFGVVSSAGGSVALDATNSSEDDSAESGAANGSNFGQAIASDAVVDVVEFEPTPGSIEAGLLVADIVHEGDNDSAVDQSADAASGDAVAGGQIAGFVASGGDVDAVLDNTSEDSEALSGDADASNTGGGFAGDLVATLFLVGDRAIEADAIDAAIVHEGDNDFELAQDAGAATGDAVAGGQVAGVVATEGGNVSIDATNNSEDAESTSGDSTTTNDGGGFAGDAVFLGGEVAPGSAAIEADLLGAFIVHEGDNDTSIDQSMDSGSGDAVAGGQVIGVVAAGDVDIVQDNTSEDDTSTSGDATGSNTEDSITGDIVGDVDLFEILGLFFLV